LNSGGDGVEHDGLIQRPWMSPAMKNLIAKQVLVGFIQFLQILKVSRTLSDESSLFQEWEDIDEVCFVGKVLDILEKLVLGNSSERIPDPIVDDLV
jgi:hypothetical protein